MDVTDRLIDSTRKLTDDVRDMKFRLDSIEHAAKLKSENFWWFVSLFGYLGWAAFILAILSKKAGN